MGALMWYRWTSIEAFNAWHGAAMHALNIPHPPIDATTGEVDTARQWTTAYTKPHALAPDDVRAYVEEHVAAMVPEALGMESEAPPYEEEDL